MSLTHSTFEELFDAIADAIREQEGSSATIVTDNFPTRIRSLTPTGAGLDTSDATATASDIAAGVTAYVNGSKITGSINTISSSTTFSRNCYNYSGSTYSSGVSFNEDQLIRANTNILIQEPLSNFGDVSTSDVLLNSTFTSSAGYKTKGTFTIDTEISTQESLISQIQTALEGKCGGVNTADATATVNDILSGKTAYINSGKVTGTYTPLDTSDATASASTIMSGYTAYVNGSKITGTKTEKTITTVYNDTSGTNIQITGTPSGSYYLNISITFNLPSNAELLYLYMPFSLHGGGDDSMSFYVYPKSNQAASGTLCYMGIGNSVWFFRDDSCTITHSGNTCTITISEIGATNNNYQAYVNSNYAEFQFYAYQS